MGFFNPGKVIGKQGEESLSAPLVKKKSPDFRN